MEAYGKAGVVLNDVIDLRYTFVFVDLKKDIAGDVIGCRLYLCRTRVRIGCQFVVPLKPCFGHTTNEDIGVRGEVTVDLSGSFKEKLGVGINVGIIPDK